MNTRAKLILATSKEPHSIPHIIFHTSFRPYPANQAHCPNWKDRTGLNPLRVDLFIPKLLIQKVWRRH